MNTLDTRTVFRPWGWYIMVHSDFTHWTKLLTIAAGESLSLQYHEDRFEFWMPMALGLTGIIGDTTLDLVPGVRYDVPRFTHHRLINDSDQNVDLLEVATGRPREADIVRLDDKYGR